MNQPRPFQQHADAVHSEAFTGNLRRASLLPGEIAVRQPVSQDIRAAAGISGRPQTAGASLYPRRQDASPLIRGVERPWWYWLTLTTTLVLIARRIILALSDSSVR